MPDPTPPAATCSSCRHWGVAEADRHCPSGWGACASPRVERGYGGVSQPDTTLLLVEDDEGWGVYSAPTFGCVLHEPKT